MISCKQNDLDISLNTFLKQGFLNYFGNQIFDKWFQNCLYFAVKKRLIIQTENQEIANFINNNLTKDIIDFCKISWPKTNITPIACTDISNIKEQEYTSNNMIDNVISIDEYRGHSFDDFIVSDENKIAFDSISSIVQKSDKIFANGTIIYLTGDVGSGKTHLLKAAEHYANKYKKQNVCYLSAEVFSSQYITAVKENKLFDMRNIIIANDVLLIDDIGFISHRKSTMDELGSIISIMLDGNKDVIITTTANISVFKDHKRLYNRLLSAVYINVETASIDLKKQIIKKSQLPLNNEIIDFLANNIIGGARELKGALNRIKINQFLLANITIPALVNLLSDLLKNNSVSNVYKNDLEMVLSKVAEYYQISIADLKNNKTIKNNKIARSIAIYLCRELCGFVYVKIANEFGFSTHATVIHSISKLKNNLENDKSLEYDLNAIITNIRNNII